MPNGSSSFSGRLLIISKIKIPIQKEKRKEKKKIMEKSFTAAMN
jgi:hypothetical protein